MVQETKKYLSTPTQPTESYSEFSPGIKAWRQSAQYQEGKTGKEPVPEAWSSLTQDSKKVPVTSQNDGSSDDTKI